MLTLDNLKQQAKSNCYTYISDRNNLKDAPEGIRLRCLIERTIIRKLVDEALAAGFVVSYSDGESSYERFSDTEKLMAEVQATDEEVLRLSKDGHRYYVTLIYCNDGYDVIADHSLNEEDEAYCNLLERIEFFSDLFVE